MAKLFSRRTAAVVAVAAASMLVLSACSNSDSGSGDTVKVSLITKDQSNPFFVAMIKGATAKAETLGVELTVTSGVDESDYAGQITAIGSDSFFVACHGGQIEVLKAKGVTDLASFNTKGMDQPGFKVLHMADIDFRTHYPTLKDALTALKTWSDQHPGHTPVFMMIEAKDSGFPILENSTKVLPFDQKAYDELDEEIVKYLGKDKIITPKEVQGSCCP